MANLNEILQDKQKYADTVEIPFGDVKFTLGELRTIQASGVNLQGQLEEIQRQKKLAEDALLEQWQKNTELEAQLKAAPKNEPIRQPVDNWMDDPVFAGPAKEYKSLAEKIAAVENERKQEKEGTLRAVRALLDRSIRDEYYRLPEDFRKETPFEQAVRLATEKKYLDPAGIPTVSKVYEEWNAPRAAKAKEEALRAEIEAKVRQEQMASMLPRPGGMPGAPVNDPNAPKSMKESFSRLKSDPVAADEFLQAVYGVGRGQA